jgi:hypothetical protein
MVKKTSIPRRSAAGSNPILRSRKEIIKVAVDSGFAMAPTARAVHGGGQGNTDGAVLDKKDKL